MRTRKIAVLVSMLAVLMTASALPAHADPPESLEENIFFIFPDEENGLAVFWNTTRDAFCAWEDGGFVGPEPVIEPVTVSTLETGKGAIVASFRATRPIELWMLDEDADLSGPCTDTDAQSGPWATGEATVTSNDNDVFVSGTRTNSFGDHGRGTVVDSAGGQWFYSWVFRAHCVVDCEVDFTVKAENFNLKKIS